MVNNFFGIADKELAIYEDAVFYYKEAINDCTDSISKQSPLNNIAVVYILQKKYDKAIIILESILDKKNLDTIFYVYVMRLFKYQILNYECSFSWYYSFP